MKYKTITHIGTLPPLKPNSYYSIMLINSLLSKGVSIDFISFKKMYPEFIYRLFFRDTQFHTDKKFVLSKKNNLSVRYVITYINPLWDFTFVIASIRSFFTGCKSIKPVWYKKNSRNTSYQKWIMSLFILLIKNFIIMVLGISFLQINL